VIMAEAAAMALAASIISALRISSPAFLTDNQQLVTLFKEQISPLLRCGKSSHTRKDSSMPWATPTQGCSKFQGT
jgi:hypothetical protein